MDLAIERYYEKLNFVKPPLSCASLWPNFIPITNWLQETLYLRSSLKGILHNTVGGAGKHIFKNIVFHLSEFFNLIHG